MLGLFRPPDRRRAELRGTTFYEPPYDITHRQADPWRVVLVPGSSRRALTRWVTN